MRQGKLDEAIAAFAAVLAIDRQNLQAHINLRARAGRAWPGPRGGDALPPGPGSRSKQRTGLRGSTGCRGSPIRWPSTHRLCHFGAAGLDGIGNTLKNVRPSVEGGLTEESHVGIPRRVVALAEPNPIGCQWERSQTGAPRAPAKCAIAVSAVTTRSRLQITAAVSMKGPATSSSRPDRSRIGKSAAAICSGPNPFCRLTSRTPGNLASGAKWANGIERQRSERNLREPCQAMPIFKPSIPETGN